MAMRDVDFFAFAREFPAAVLSLFGIAFRKHVAESVNAKEQSLELDLVFRSKDPRAPLVYLEVQERGDVDVERSALIKLAVLCRDLKRWRNAQAAILYSSDSARRKARKADVVRKGRRTVLFTPERLVLSEVEPDRLLQRGGPALALLPLVGRGEVVTRRAPSWLARLWHDQTLSRRARRRLRDFFDRFLRRRTRGRLTVEAPVFAEEYLAQSKGMQKLVAEREARGEARGEAREKVAGRRDAILKVLEARFGKVSKSFVATLERTTDPKRLDRALVLAATAESVAEVARALGKPARARRQPTRSSARV